MKLDQKLNYLLLFTIVLTLLLIVVMTIKSKESFWGRSMQEVSSNNTSGSGMQKVPSNNTSGSGFSFASAAMKAAGAMDTAGTAVTGTALGHKKTVEMARHVKEFCDKYGHKPTAGKRLGSVAMAAQKTQAEVNTVNAEAVRKAFKSFKK